jgi:CHASE2 domain-containing sensor protein/tRNA A-37 threonylcarbamoyl transferase component Bud32
MRIKQTIPDWLVGLLVTMFFLFITFTGILDFTDAIEMKTFDFRAKLAASGERNPDIELVVISDDDLSELGRFPWPRNILAQGIQNLSLAGAKVIALNILFTEPEESAGLKAIRRLRKDYEEAGLAQQGPGLAFYEDLSEALANLDNDAKLYTALKNAGNVVLPVYFDTLSAGRDTEVPDFIAKNAFKKIEGANQEWAISSLIWLSKLKPLLPSFAEVSGGIGHLNLFTDQDGYIRKQNHVLGYLKGTYFPSFPLAIVKLYKGLKDEDMTVVLGEGINLKVSPSSTIKVPAADAQMGTLINWNQGPAVAFHRTPFTKVYNNQVQTSLFRDKIVIIGPTAPGIGDRFVTPVSGNLPGVEVVANSVASILNQGFFSRPHWSPLIELAVLILFGIFLTLVLPRLKAGIGAVTTLGLLVGYSGVGTVLFFSSNIWLKITPPILLLILGYVLIISKRFLITEKKKEQVEADSFETNKMLGISFQQQGMLDLAFEKFQRLSIVEDGVKDLLYNLGLDEDGKNFKDLDERIPKLKDAEATMIFGTSAGKHPGDIGATLMDLETKPTLGRYEITGELGRGAMGVVYKGQDPKIRRTVAIKTIMLSEFDEDSLDEMKERFFREAESAGLLTHPNIVTIYDCGEEHDLAYIAMEYLEGVDLEEFTKPDNLFPMRKTLAAVADVAQALDYAHTKDIVHRDIKPANIMMLRATEEIKVTDFGIARITSSSKTKTGVVLGTPSYMSPEQVSGKKVDGRSDIFSLGVVLFELLTGQKPFTGEDITSLMFKIAKEKHPSPREINPRIPSVLEKIIDKALEKDLEKRYQRAGEMAAHLNRVIAKIDEIRSKKAPKTDE